MQNPQLYHLTTLPAMPTTTTKPATSLTTITQTTSLRNTLQKPLQPRRSCRADAHSYGQSGLPIHAPLRCKGGKSMIGPATIALVDCN